MAYLFQVCLGLAGVRDGGLIFCIGYDQGALGCTGDLDQLSYSGGNPKRKSAYEWLPTLLGDVAMESIRSARAASARADTCLVWTSRVTRFGGIFYHFLFVFVIFPGMLGGYRQGTT